MVSLCSREKLFIEETNRFIKTKKKNYDEICAHVQKKKKEGKDEYKDVNLRVKFVVIWNINVVCVDVNALIRQERWEFWSFLSIYLSICLSIVIY